VAGLASAGGDAEAPPDLPRHMAGGPDNPLGARAMYLGNTLYRIHGSNEPETIGQAVSSGCIRMTNEDVVDLYSASKSARRWLCVSFPFIEKRPASPAFFMPGTVPGKALRSSSAR
jgi:hypothetical protein